MLDSTRTKFSHLKPAYTFWRTGGLRDFILYKDLHIADATSGRVIAHLAKANMAPEKGTGWRRHEADSHIVIMTKGRAKRWQRKTSAASSRPICARTMYSPMWAPTASSAAGAGRTTSTRWCAM